MWYNDSRRLRISFNLVSSTFVLANLSTNSSKIEWQRSWAAAESKLSDSVGLVDSDDDAGGGRSADTGIDGGGNGGGGDEFIWGGDDAKLSGGGWYFAVENGIGRPSAVVFTGVWLAADDCIGNATRLFKLVRGFDAFVAWLAVAAVGIGGGSFQPGSYVANCEKNTYC